jgi:hypothetical protein
LPLRAWWQVKVSSPAGVGEQRPARTAFTAARRTSSVVTTDLVEHHEAEFDDPEEHEQQGTRTTVN